MLLVLNNFIKNLLIVKSKDASCDEDKGNDSKSHSDIGMHLLESSCSVTSSEAILPNLPKLHSLPYKRIALQYQENI